MSTREHPGPSPTLRDRLLRPGAVVAEVTLVVLVAAAVTLSRVDVSVTSPPVSDNPTPLGYTWSLVLFILPLLYRRIRRRTLMLFLTLDRYRCQHWIMTVSLSQRLLSFPTTDEVGAFVLLHRNPHTQEGDYFHHIIHLFLSVHYISVR